MTSTELGGAGSQTSSLHDGSISETASQLSFLNLSFPDLFGIS